MTIDNLDLIKTLMFFQKNKEKLKKLNKKIIFINFILWSIFTAAAFLFGLLFGTRITQAHTLGDIKEMVSQQPVVFISCIIVLAIFFSIVTPIIKNKNNDMQDNNLK